MPPSILQRYSPGDVERFYRDGHWQTSTLVDLVDSQAATWPDRAFISDSTSSLTFGQLQARGYGLAAGFRRAGVRPGDRVALQMPNWTEFASAMVAVCRLGAISVPIMPIFRDDEVRYILEHSGAKAVLTPQEFRDFDHLAMYRRLRPEVPSLESIVVVRGDAGGDFDFEDLVVDVPLDALAGELGEPPGADDEHITIYTSGTTSRPKGCRHTWNTAAFSARMMVEQLGWTTDDVAFGPSPVTHSTGYITSMLIPLLAGGSSHLMEQWEPEAGLERIRQHRCTAAVTATAFLQMLLGVYDPARHDGTSMRVWVAAGSPIPPSVVEGAREMFRGSLVLSLYGRSENFVSTMCTVDDAPERSTTSDGSAHNGVEIAVVGPDGAERPRGDEGDIAYRGPGHMIDYFRNPTETVALFTPEGFSRSGDLGRMDADGFVRITGRLKDIIIRGGQNISAREIEEHLLAHPGVKDTAVVAMPDERLGERVCAFVVPADPAEPLGLDDVTAYLRDRRIAVQKLPERLEVVEALPMTTTGKVQKHLLRARIAAALEAQSTLDAGA